MDTNNCDVQLNIPDIYLNISNYKSRVKYLKSRQMKRREVIIRHLLRTYPDVWNLLNPSQTNNTNIRHLFGFGKQLSSFDDESMYKKRAILPVITRLKAPTLGSDLLVTLQNLVEPNLDNQESYQKWDKFSLEAVGDKLRQTLASGLKSDIALKDQTFSKNPLHQTNMELNEPDGLIIKTYAGSSAFLKGTQSANPHNDYSQHFVDTGERPQNFIRDTGLKNRFEEYPKLRELIRLKDQFTQLRSTPPMYLQADLRNFDLNDLQSKFDAILIEPPLEEYHRMTGAVFDQYWNWDEIERLPIEQIASPRSFVWLWCGSGHGLDAARKCLRKWGFRRCEDICWIKTNLNHPGHEALEPGALFQRTKEHCLMGIHGTVRRSTDGDFIHANIDIDLIIEEPVERGVGYAAKDKPTEMFHIIEHFCLGRRRLHLFGRDSTLRPGWVTVGNELSASNYDPKIYANHFAKDPNGMLLGSTEEIERLRPKSPPPPIRVQPGKPNPSTTQSVSTSSAFSLINPNSSSSLLNVVAGTNPMNSGDTINSRHILGSGGAGSSNSSFNTDVDMCNFSLLNSSFNTPTHNTGQGQHLCTTNNNSSSSSSSNNNNINLNHLFHSKLLRNNTSATGNNAMGHTKPFVSLLSNANHSFYLHSLQRRLNQSNVKIPNSLTSLSSSSPSSSSTSLLGLPTTNNQKQNLSARNLSNTHSRGHADNLRSLPQQHKSSLSSAPPNITARNLTILQAAVAAAAAAAAASAAVASIDRNDSCAAASASNNNNHHHPSAGMQSASSALNLQNANWPMANQIALALAASVQQNPGPPPTAQNFSTSLANLLMSGKLNSILNSTTVNNNNSSSSSSSNNNNNKNNHHPGLSTFNRFNYNNNKNLQSVSDPTISMNLNNNNNNNSNNNSSSSSSNNLSTLNFLNQLMRGNVNVNKNWRN